MTRSFDAAESKAQLSSVNRALIVIAQSLSFGYPRGVKPKVMSRVEKKKGSLEMTEIGWCDGISIQ